MQDSNESRPSRGRLLKGLLPVRRASAIRDVCAGISLASMDIPQVLGYAPMVKLRFLADILLRTMLVGFLAGVGVQMSIAMLCDILRKLF